MGTSINWGYEKDGFCLKKDGVEYHFTYEGERHRLSS